MYIKVFVIATLPVIAGSDDIVSGIHAVILLVKPEFNIVIDGNVSIVSGTDAIILLVKPEFNIVIDGNVSIVSGTDAIILLVKPELPIEIAGSDDIVRGTHVVILTLDVSGQLVTLTLPLIAGRLSTETVPVIATNGLYTIADLNIVSIDKLSKSPDTSVKVNLKYRDDGVKLIKLL